jgi:hypothetical protein
MESESSLPCLQGSATGPYPEPHKYSQLPSYSRKIYFNINLTQYTFLP